MWDLWEVPDGAKYQILSQQLKPEVKMGFEEEDGMEEEESG